ncbi:histidine phosphatase family protein [Pseudenhygromyxa sp. WMMC2535]|uniref:histidine phosphatase family protein n=1 Tax=Pseudenhygromyxa sp. WMMC2535 TaxID=2712867 RepID=UPI0015533C59|nr:histidine phosphatase family protein [Pseudenhygromyxa sp. WMMC2535]NVB40061.1 histidine phosphatase family protein [Pseudenhygromyxa sp. WMMC2535]
MRVEPEPCLLQRRRSLRLLGVGLAASLVAALGCGDACACAQLPQAEPITVYIVRHAEKQVSPGETGDMAADEAARRDPPLSAEGQARALALAEDLPLRELDAIYVTASRRSEETAAAVAAVTGIEPTHYPPRDIDGLLARLRREAGTVSLVVGHSNTIPPLLEALGVEEKVRIGEKQYGDLWIVHTLPEGGTSLEHRRFGEAVARFDLEK